MTFNTLLCATLLALCTSALTPRASLACPAAEEVRITYSSLAPQLPTTAAGMIADALAKAKGSATSPDHYTVFFGVVASNAETPALSVRRSLTSRRGIALAALLSELGVPDTKVATPTSEIDSELTRRALHGYAQVFILYGCRGPV